MEHYLESLNPEQYKAVTTTDGPVLIIAGAGTGKTHTLTTRIVHLVHSGVLPHHILAVTFTNKAAREMLERVTKNLPTIQSSPILKTFHSLGVSLLREFHTEVGLDKNFSIIDTDDQVQLLKIAMEAQNISTKEFDPKSIIRTISRLRSASDGNLHGIEPRNLIESMSIELWERYRDQKRRSQAVDFDDLIEIPVHLLSHNASVRNIVQSRIKYLHIDEYQDTSDTQFRFARLLLGDHNNLCAVGDGDQTIYSWRGATIRNILQFPNDFSGASVITLTANYRSTQSILDAANQVVSKNQFRIPKDLIATTGGGNRIVRYPALNETDEAFFVAQRIRASIDNMSHQQNLDLSRFAESPSPALGQKSVFIERPNSADAHKSVASIAVLYRSHFQSRAIEEALVSENLPYQIAGTKFFARREIKDVLAWVRAAHNRTNLVDLKRVVEFPKCGIGRVGWANICAQNVGALSGKTRESWVRINDILDRISAYTTTHTPSEVVIYTIRESGIESVLRNSGDVEDLERLQNINELVTYAARFDTETGTPTDQLLLFLEQSALLSEQDTVETDSGGISIQLMTIHASKGLEFDLVFIVGLEEGVFPSNIGADDGGRDPEEERRLMYVALTRARQELVLTHAWSRRIFGSTQFQKPSTFLDDIAPDLVEVIGEQREPIKTVYLDW